MKVEIVCVALCIAMGGCASIVEGTSQNITVNTNPAGAECGIYREGGIRIATVVNTPGSALVNKTKHDIWIACVKQGYSEATYLNHSGVAGGTLGNIILGGGIGWAIDSADGADNKYDGTVNITLVPLPAGAGSSPVQFPATFQGEAPAPAPAAAAKPVS